jgi:type I restriction enzyme R subunit
MSEITEFAISQFEQLGYQYVYGPSIAPDSETPERERWGVIISLPIGK